MIPLLMDLLYLPLAGLYLFVILYQIVVLKKNRRGWRERFGFIRPRHTNQPCVWIHAVSLGEVNATRSLVAEIERRLPDHIVAISTTTDTGYAAACQHYSPRLVFRYPLDFSCVVRRVLNRIKPVAIVLMELEVWPNLVKIAEQRAIPILIANGRVTEQRSMRRFRIPLVRSLARSMFRRIAWVGTQTDEYARRFAELGVPRDRIRTTGSMKYDTALVADSVPGDEQLALAMSIDRNLPLIVAGSTGPGEEEIILDAYSALIKERPGLQLAIIPRKPERFDEVARLIENRGYFCCRRSRVPDGSPAFAATAARSVLLGDTMGELRKFYSLATAVFVGRTLVPMGGSDLMEVAALARPLCFGSHVENFADSVDQLRKANAAVQLQKADELAGVFRWFLDNPVATTAMARRAQEVVQQNTGATKRTVDLLCQCLGRMTANSTIKQSPTQH